ncbi:MAG: hypothetical protein RLZZ241_2124 [Bacteroidota bacterium]
MRTFYALAFTVLYMLAMYRPVAPVFDYLMNRDYIAEVFCINKDKPELSCNGQCYLMKTLKEKQQQDNSKVPPINLQEYPIGFFNILEITAILVPVPVQEFTTHPSEKIASFKAAIFHPPNRTV